MAASPEFVETGDLDRALVADAARLAHEAFADFYELFTRDRERLLPAIGAQFRCRSELNQLVAAVDRGSLVGLGAFYDLAEMRERQMEGARLLLEAADDHLASAKSLRAFARSFDLDGAAGAYISRFSIAAERRGSGLAARLLERVEAAIAERGWRAIRLHVRRDNARALAFYAKSGYLPRGREDLGYVLLGKETTP